MHETSCDRVTAQGKDHAAALVEEQLRSAMTSNAPKRFTLCNDQYCNSKFNILDVATVHTFVNGPDPRDHLTNECNFLTWLRTGTILSLIGNQLLSLYIYI